MTEDIHELPLETAEPVAPEDTAARGESEVAIGEDVAEPDSGAEVPTGDSRANRVLAALLALLFLVVVVVGYIAVTEVIATKAPQTLGEAEINDLKYQIAADPENASLYLKLADAYHRIGEYDQAMGTLEDLRDREVTGVTLAYTLYGMGRIEETRGMTDEAIAKYQESIDVFETSDARFALARVDMALEEWDDAVVNLERYAELRPTDAGGLVQLAHAYEKKGDNARALDLYRRALTFIPDDPDIASAIARLEGQQ